jgi:hypothetical protein
VEKGSGGFVVREKQNTTVFGSRDFLTGCLHDVATCAIKRTTNRHVKAKS